ncbi:MAG: hypothetical protein KME14_20275 [Tildeniella torsiva UHER 1998/13D]|jgi:hypothetical protein|nr:hypothetical protein [Tildeniella torsiva UHER 1998/13D]
MATVYPPAYAQASLAGGVAIFDAGTGTPTVKIYDGATLLLTFNLNSTAAFGTPTMACPSIATVTGLPISAVAVASGTADNAKLISRDGSYEVTTDSVSATDDGGAIQLSSLSVTIGQPFDLTGCTVSQPCS